MDAKTFLTEFRNITSSQEGVRTIREVIVYFAVHGELINSSASNRAAAEYLLQKAAELRKRLRDAGEARSIEQPEAVPKSYTGNYPSGWALTRLGNVVRLVSGQHLAEEKQNRQGIGMPYFTGASDFGRLYPIVTRWTTAGRAIAIEGDILLAVKGGSTPLNRGGA